MVYGLQTEAEREREMHILLYYCFTIALLLVLLFVYSKQLWQAYCYVGICICIQYINWHSNLIYIYYWFTNKDLQYDSSFAPFPFPKFPMPWPPGDSRGRDFAGLLPGDVCCHGHGKIILLGTKERGGPVSTCFNCAFFLSKKNRRHEEDIKING